MCHGDKKNLPNNEPNKLVAGRCILLRWLMNILDVEKKIQFSVHNFHGLLIDNSACKFQGFHFFRCLLEEICIDRSQNPI